jgi:hypothetical protein
VAAAEVTAEGVRFFSGWPMGFSRAQAPGFRVGRVVNETLSVTWHYRVSLSSVA